MGKPNDEEIEQEKLELSRRNCDIYCKKLDKLDWKYDKEDDNLHISSGYQGEDLPIKFKINFDPKRCLATLYSWMPYNIPEDKRVDVALAITIANYRFVDGSFDFDLSDGSIMFRLTTSYKDIELSEAICEYMLFVSLRTIDDYNDKFFMVGKGMLSVEEFAQQQDK